MLILHDYEFKINSNMDHSILLNRSLAIYGSLVDTFGPDSRHYTTLYLIIPQVIYHLDFCISIQFTNN